MPTEREDRRSDPAEFARLLSDAALAGEDAGQLLRRVAAEAGAPCRLVTPDGTLVAATDLGPGVALHRGVRTGDRVAAADGWTATALVLAVGAQPRRVLLVDARIGASALDLAAAAGTALLIDAVRFSECAPGPTNPVLAAGEIVSALRRGWATPHVVLAGRSLGLLGDAPVSAAVLHYEGQRHRTWHTALTWLDHPVEPDGADAWTLVRDPAQLDALRRSLTATVDDGRVTATAGSPTADPAALGASFDEARRLLALARARDQPVLHHADAGVLQVLLTTPRDRLEQYARAGLGPVLDKPDLLRTLRAWLAESGSRQNVSELLHLHRNSVGYRVRQLKDLLGVDPLEPAAAARLHLAIEAWDLLAAETPAE